MIYTAQWSPVANGYLETNHVLRIIENSVKRVFVGVLEPANFVNCTGVQQLLDAGIEVIAVQAEGLKEKCLAPNKHVLQK